MSATISASDWRGIPAPGGARPAFIALLALLVWAPIPLASNRVWSEALLAAGALALLFAVLLAALWRGVSLGLRLNSVRWPAGLLAASAAYALLQTIPLPGSLLSVLSPRAADVWQAIGVSEGSLSLDRGASAASTIHLASLCAVFVLTVWCVSSRRRLIVACTAVVAIGVFESLTGIGVELSRASGLLARGPEEGVGGASGTFVNPNHFAGMLEMCLCVSVGLFLTMTPMAGVPGSGREAATRALGFVLSPRLLLIAAQVLMLIALLWSGSRGAVLALVVAVPVVFGLVLPPSSSRANPRARIALLAGMAIVVVGALALGGAGTLGEKFVAQGLSGNRIDLLAATLSMAADYPLTGAGAGSYASVFPAYKSEPLGMLFYEHAHNDYLEGLAEGGIIGVSLFFGAVATALVAMLQRARRRRSRHARALTAACAAAVLSLLVHGLYDFNLQIPANATLFVFLLGLGLCASQHARDGKREHLT